MNNPPVILCLFEFYIDRVQTPCKSKSNYLYHPIINLNFPLHQIRIYVNFIFKYLLLYISTSGGILLGAGGKGTYRRASAKMNSGRAEACRRSRNAGESFTLSAAPQPSLKPHPPRLQPLKPHPPLKPLRTHRSRYSPYS